MRITVDLDREVHARVREVARERGQPLKTVFNDVVRAGLIAEAPQSERYRFPSNNLGLRPHIDIDHALRLAGELEDAERTNACSPPCGRHRSASPHTRT